MLSDLTIVAEGVEAARGPPNPQTQIDSDSRLSLRFVHQPSLGFPTVVESGGGRWRVECILGAIGKPAYLLSTVKTHGVGEDCWVLVAGA